MSTMKKLDQAFIAVARRQKYAYFAVLSKDKSSIVIQRVIREHEFRSADDDPKTYQNVATFIDCDDYIFSAIQTDIKRYDTNCRLPYEEYEDSIPEEHKDMRGYMVECITPYNNVMRVRLDHYNPKENVFHRFAITISEGDRELIIAYLDVNEDHDMDVELFGYPAGPEVEDN